MKSLLLARELLQADQHLFKHSKVVHMKQSIKTAVEVIEVWNESILYEMTPERSKVASVVAVFFTILCLLERSFSGLRCLKTYLRNMRGQHTRLNILAIVCIGHSYGNKVCVNNMNKIINIYAQPQWTKNFFSLNKFLILTRMSRGQRGWEVWK